MRGKELKQWMLKRAKSGVEDKGNNGAVAKPRVDDNVIMRDISGRQGLSQIADTNQGSAVTSNEKVTFIVRGVPFRVNSRYSYSRPLGIGAYGVVCAANDAQLQRQVAIKKIASVFEDLTDAKRILREIRLISCMQHDNILRIIDIDEPESYAEYSDVYIVTELMDTDLNKLVRSKHPLLEAQRKFFTYQILRALKYIHRYGLVTFISLTIAILMPMG